MWIVIIIVIVISFVVFFTPAVDPKDWFAGGQSGGPTQEEIDAQRDVMVADALRTLQRRQPLPDKVNFDNFDLMQTLGQGNSRANDPPEADRIAYEGLVRLRLLNQAKSLGIEFDDEAIRDDLERRFSGTNGQFDVNLYNNILDFLEKRRLSEDDLKRYVRTELTLRHLHQAMGTTGGLLSNQAIMPLANDQLVAQYTEYETKVAIFKAEDFNGSVNNATQQLPGFYTNNYRPPVKTRLVQVRLAYTNDATRNIAIKRVNKLTKQLKEPNNTVTALQSIVATDSDIPKLTIETNDIEAATLGQHPLGKVIENEGGRGKTNYIHPNFIRQENAFVFAGKVGDLEEVFPKFGTLKPERVAEIRGDFIGREAIKLANEAGESFRTNLVNELNAGKTFDAICKANTNAHLLSLPPFTMRSQPNDPKLAMLTTNNLNLSPLQRDASQINVDEIGKPAERLAQYNSISSSDSQGYILFLDKHTPPNTESLSKELGEIMFNYRMQHEVASTQRIFEPRRQQDFIPMAMAVNTGRNWPDWMRRDVEIAQLDLFLSAKSRRLDEIQEILEIENGTLKEKLKESPELKKRVTDLNTKWADLRPEWDKVNNELQTLSKKRASSEGNVTELDEKIGGLHIELQKLNVQIGPIQQQRGILMGQIPTLENERDNLIPLAIQAANQRLKELGQTAGAGQ